MLQPQTLDQWLSCVAEEAMEFEGMSEAIAEADVKDLANNLETLGSIVRDEMTVSQAATIVAQHLVDA